ncbi:carbon starvation protein [Verrucomicrobia bacterium]|nr:carbon starvation protein [Verrucomicrobiota bacterium]
MKKVPAGLFWFLLALAGAWAYATLAFHQGEHLNSVFILIAALCSYAIGYRFYSKWIAARVLALDDRRATPCEVHDDGKDFVRTNKWIVFGQHFAAIAGPGPLVGPVLAAQFGYLPGTLWILIGVTLGGAVQDFVVLCASLRRDGKSLGQMVKEELNTAAGLIALVAILAILVILLAVLALIVVKTLAESPWGLFTVGATIPIAMFMGCYLRFGRAGKIMEASAIGVICLLLAVWGGKLVHESPQLGQVFGVRDITLAWAIILYGLAASVLPVWLLLAPRGYLSTFMKLGTIFALAFGIVIMLPNLQMPAVTRFVDGSGLIISGKVFPFCFITIACGAISGFHTLIASATTPKILTRESYARTVGYGAMCLESLVAIMALIAACTLEPGIYFGMNVASSGADSVARAAVINQKIRATGADFVVSADAMDRMAAEVKEKTLFNRTGGAATLAAGMANIFSYATHGRWLDLWYHFAIMFEALFILTTLDAGTRAGRYLLQDVLGSVCKPLGETKGLGANVLASVLMVGGWGYFLIQGVRDPLGGINSLWPLFGIANQMLAAIGLCLGTTVILKMSLRQERERKPLLALITFVPLLWLLAVTWTAGAQKIFHADPRIGFLAQAHELGAKVRAAEGRIDSAGAQIEVAKERRLVVNARIDAVVTGLFLLLIGAIALLSLREWVLLLAGRKAALLRETEPVWLPGYAVAEGGPVRLAGFIALAVMLAKEISGEAQLERARQATEQCQGEHGHPVAASGARGELCRRPADQGEDDEADRARSPRQGPKDKGRAYVETAERQFRGISRCC